MQAGFCSPGACLCKPPAGRHLHRSQHLQSEPIHIACLRASQIRQTTSSRTNDCASFSISVPLTRNAADSDTRMRCWVLGQSAHSPALFELKACPDENWAQLQCELVREEAPSGHW